MLVDGAQGGQTAAIIANPAAAFWTTVETRLAAAGVTTNQVQAIWLKEADAGPTAAFPVHAQTLKSEYIAILHNIRDKYPNARLAYLASRIYAGYATSPLNPEPFAYEQGFTLQWTIGDQIAGSAALEFDPAVGPVVSPWIDWGTYNWADGLVPRSDGLTWLCTDFVADGTHPSPAGRLKVAQRLFAFVHSEPTAASWYLAHPAPAAYGTAKMTTIGTFPSIGSSGTPTFTANDFAVRVSNGLPGGVGIVFHGSLPARVPFIFAHRYVGGGITRLAVHSFDGSGAASWSVPILAPMVGTTRFYQGYMRDAAQPDGTGAVVSNALRVVYTL